MGTMADEKKDNSFARYYNMTLRYLARSIKTEQDVRRYLRRKKVPVDFIEEIISRLKDYKYIDDEEYARIFAESRKRACMGSFAVKYGLKKKGIDDSLAEDMVSKIFEDFDENSVARELALKKAEKMDGLKPAKMLSRLTSFLRRRGFSEETIFYAVEPILEKINKEGKIGIERD